MLWSLSVWDPVATMALPIICWNIKNLCVLPFDIFVCFVRFSQETRLIFPTNKLTIGLDRNCRLSFWRKQRLTFENCLRSVKSLCNIVLHFTHNSSMCYLSSLSSEYNFFVFLIFPILPAHLYSCFHHNTVWRMLRCV